MRILMLDNEFPPLGGGMGTANEALFRRFADHPDLEIDLITSALGSRYEAEQFARNIRIFKVPVWNQNIHHSTNRELLTYAALSLQLALKYHRTHVYDFCFAWSAVPAGAVAWLLRRRAGLPYMVWVSGPDIPGFEKRYRFVYPIIVPVLRAVWRGSTPLIAKCADEIKMIQQVDSGVVPIYVPNGVDLTLFQPGTPIPDDGSLHVICVARLIQRKGQHHLIQAVKQLADQGIDIKVSLVGTGDALEEYQMLARRLGVAERVHFAGYVPRKEIGKHIASAHVFVLPSFAEGMAIAALEAMACGLPVVMTRTGGTEEIIEEGVNGFTFDWADVDSLTRHLVCLSSDRAKARRMGHASRARAMCFSWDSIAERYLELFDTMMSRGGDGETRRNGSISKNMIELSHLVPSPVQKHSDHKVAQPGPDRQ